MTFHEMDISEDILRGLKKMNFVKATPVQSKAITPMMEGGDAIVLAPTGSGKTAAFGIPILEKLDLDVATVQALVLCPTRELALQIVEVLQGLTIYKSGVRVQALYGGEPIERQIKALKKRPQVIVATPGRLLDHMNRRTVRFGALKTVVLDEADRMLDMGFQHDIKRILDATPEDRQTVMFSATMAPEVLHIAEKYQRNAKRIRLAGEQKPVNSITQYYAEVGAKEKEAMLVNLLRDKRYGLALVFVSRKHLAKRLAVTLAENGFRAAALQGNMSQPQRNRVMSEYRNGMLDVLVATDVAARGIDVDDIDIVVNFDLPQDADSYVHRVGRTGRAGKSGDAYSLVSPAEAGDFRKMVRHRNAEVQLAHLERAKDFVAKKSGGGASAGKTVSPTKKSEKAGLEKTNENIFEHMLLKEKLYKEQRKEIAAEKAGSAGGSNESKKRSRRRRRRRTG